MARREKDWDVRPNLNQTPGAQGTLFSGGSKYMSDERFARGYTPERAAAVRAGVQMSEFGARGHETEAKVTHARLSDTIARSTAPVEHLSNLQWAHVNPGEHLTAGNTASGLYMPARGERTHGLIAVKPENNRGGTVLHELGHHVSHEADSEHARNYSHSSEHGGKEEALADNYEEQHFRDRRGKQTDAGIYGGGKYAGHTERSDSFWDGYHKNRSMGVYRADVERQNEDYYKVMPEERVHPDGSTDEPLLHKDLEHDHEEIRKRTATVRMNPDAHPGGLWGVQ